MQQQLHILAEFEGSSDKDRKAMLIRLKDIYVKNYYGVKHDKKNEENQIYLKASCVYIFNRKHRGSNQASRERKTIDKSVERESAAMLLYIKEPKLLQRIFPKN